MCVSVCMCWVCVDCGTYISFLHIVTAGDENKTHEEPKVGWSHMLWTDMLPGGGWGVDQTNKNFRQWNKVLVSDLKLDSFSLIFFFFNLSLFH